MVVIERVLLPERGFLLECVLLGGRGGVCGIAQRRVYRPAPRACGRGVTSMCSLTRMCSLRPRACGRGVRGQRHGSRS